MGKAPPVPPGCNLYLYHLPPTWGDEGDGGCSPRTDSTSTAYSLHIHCPLTPHPLRTHSIARVQMAIGCIAWLTPPGVLHASLLPLSTPPIRSMRATAAWRHATDSIARHTCHSIHATPYALAPSVPIRPCAHIIGRWWRSADREKDREKVTHMLPKERRSRTCCRRIEVTHMLPYRPYPPTCCRTAHTIYDDAGADVAHSMYV